MIVHLRRASLFSCALLSTLYFLFRIKQVAFAFEKLNVFQKAVDFADNISNITQKFPRGCFYLADQLNRASLSIAANIAEGNGRFTKPDRKNFFGIARGSAQEGVPLLELARRRGLLADPDHSKQKDNLEASARPPPAAARAPSPESGSKSSGPGEPPHRCSPTARRPPRCR